MSSLDPAPAADPSTAPLPAPTALATFGRLDAEGIRYCVWKGSVRLGANLHGHGDLDVLVHPDDLPSFRRLLGEHRWRQPTPTGPHRPHTEDHFLLDEATGQLVHLDLLLGSELPDAGRVAVAPCWRDLLLDGRRAGPGGIAVPDPAAEAALLLVRLAAAARPWHRVVSPIGRRSLVDRRAELETLLAATSPRAVLEALSRVAVADVAAARAALERTTWPHLLRFRESLVTRSPGRERGRVRDRLEHAWRFQARVICHLGRVYLHRPLCPRRGLPQGGLIVAVVGTDGSGKSTLVHQLIGTYDPKFDTLGLYLGSGDGRSSLLRLPLKLVRDLVRPPKRTPSVASSPHRPPLLSAERAVWALVLAHEKHVKLRHARRARDRGQLVLCDRYPQTQIPGELDGPLLAAWADAPWRALQLLAGVERRAYDFAACTAPDLVLSLDVDAATAAARRPGLDVAYLERRATFLRSLRWGPRTRVEIIDATAAPEEVLRRASRTVWWTEPS
jgi:thymidylate kinase